MVTVAFKFLAYVTESTKVEYRRNKMIAEPGGLQCGRIVFLLSISES